MKASKLYYWFKSYGVLLKGWILPIVGDALGRVLRLQPAQLACLQLNSSKPQEKTKLSLIKKHFLVLAQLCIRFLTICCKSLCNIHKPSARMAITSYILNEHDISQQSKKNHCIPIIHKRPCPNELQEEYCVKTKVIALGLTMSDPKIMVPNEP